MDSSEENSMIKKIKIVRGGEDEDGDGVMLDSCSQILKSAGPLARHMCRNSFPFMVMVNVLR